LTSIARGYKLTIMSGNNIYSEPRITITAKGLLESPAKTGIYNEAVKVTVKEVVDAIKKNIEEKIQSKGQERA